MTLLFCVAPYRFAHFLPADSLCPPVKPFVTMQVQEDWQFLYKCLEMYRVVFMTFWRIFTNMCSLLLSSCISLASLHWKFFKLIWNWFSLPAECDCKSGYCDMQTGECLTEATINMCNNSKSISITGQHSVCFFKPPFAHDDVSGFRLWWVHLAAD